MTAGVGRTLVGVTGVVVLVALWWFGGFGADQDEPASGTDPHSGLSWIAVEELPTEAVAVLEAIDANGPYRYDRDGTVFGNFEQILPDQPRGHYREYTVDTPGLDHRGARRIVTGSTDEFYWTEDHYESFERIDR